MEDCGNCGDGKVRVYERRAGVGLALRYTKWGLCLVCRAWFAKLPGTGWCRVTQVPITVQNQFKFY